uniref:Uncharacterized protein n=1 Tax=Arundo donax TaxID=35708 RepID=A0A0A9CX06_ARUDO
MSKLQLLARKLSWNTVVQLLENGALLASMYVDMMVAFGILFQGWWHLVWLLCLQNDITDSRIDGGFVSMSDDICLWNVTV